MDAIEMITGRRSVRKYTTEPVSHELLSEIVDVCRWSPSWANFQVARYTVVDTPQQIAAIYEHGVKGFAYNMATLKSAPGVMVISYVSGKSGTLGAKVHGADSANDSSPWEMFDAGIATQTFCLAAHAKGLGTCIFGVIDNDAIHQIAGIPPTERVAAIITYGYEAGGPVPAPARKAASDLLRFSR